MHNYFTTEMFYTVFFLVSIYSAVSADCPVDGYLPALDTCHAYNICSQGISTRQNCNFLQVYSPLTNSCVRKSPFHKCFRFDCRFFKQYSSYQGDGSLYATCQNGIPISLNKCPNGTTFHEQYQICDYECTEEGNFPDPSNCTMFKECVREGFHFRWTRTLVCPQGTWFDPNIRECSSEGTENCLQPTTASDSTSTSESTSDTGSTSTSESTSASGDTTDSPVFPW